MKFQAVTFLLILILPLILVTFWFRDGYILGAAEAEIPFYNLKRPTDITLWAWTDVQLGYVSSFIVVSNPTWSFLSWIQNLGVADFLIQAALFWFLFASAGVGTYLLVIELFPKIHPLANLSAVFFYWFNPISLTNVWNRFLYNFMFFFALLPIVSYLFVKGLVKRNYVYCIFISATTLLFSFSLTSYVFNVLMWFVFLYTTLFYSVISKNRQTVIFNIKFFLLTFLVYILFHFWWIFPTLNLFSSADAFNSLTSNVFTTAGNLNTLTLISQKLGNFIYLDRLMHASFYNGEGPAWSSIYNNWLVSLALFFLSAIIFWVIFQFRKNSRVLYLGLFFILTLFLSKGLNPPFGEVFKFFFENAVFLQVFRNPFEKFGFLLALLATPLFGYGVYELGKLYKKLSLPIYLFFILITTAVFGYPFLSGLVFTGPNYPNNDYSIGYKVEVPNYYKMADQYLSGQGQNFRFVGFPLGGEGITYNWAKGYQGVEAANSLFSTSNILFNTSGWPHYYQLVGRLEELLFKENNFYKIANTINAKYLLVRSDINFIERGMRDPKSVEDKLKQIENLGDIKEVAHFGNLKIWENLKWEDKSVYGANYLIEASPSALLDDVLLNEVNNQSVVYDSLSTFSSKDLITALIVHPSEVSGYNLSNKDRNYKFDVPEDGDYDLVLTNNQWTKNKKLLLYEDLKLVVDGSQAFSSARLREDEKVTFGTTFFKKGSHLLTFIIPTVTNLINTPETFIINNAKNELVTEINDFDPYSKYYGSFDFLIKQGPGFYLGLEQSKPSGENKSLYFQFVPVIPQYPHLRHADGVFPMSSNPESADFFLRIDSKDPTEVEFKNVTLTKLPELSPILKKSKVSPTFSTLPKISYIKNNPTSYSVKISVAKKPFVLVLSQLYNPNWVAKYQDGSIAKSHLMVNGYANGWVIDRVGDQSLTLEFTPQKLLNIGRVISVVAIIVSIILLITKMLYKKRG